MTIGHLAASISRNAGGVFHSVCGLAKAQANLRGARILVFGLEDRFTAADRNAWGGLPLRTAAVSGPRHFGFAPKLLPQIVRENPDLLHAHGLWMYPSIASWRWFRSRGRPYMISPHGMLDSWALRRSRWRKRLADWLYEGAHLRGAAVLRALCPAEARAIRACGFKNPICVIPNGVEIEANGEVQPPAWEEHATRGREVLLYLGRLHPQKNLLNLLRGWASVQRASSAARNWRLIIAGWDQWGYEHQLKQAARELSVEDTVRFPGPQFGDAKRATFSRAEAFIMPSLSEGLPMAVLEAWSYRLPVLMTLECNLADAFDAGGALQISNDPAGISAGLADFFASGAEARREVGLHGWKLVKSRFSWPGIASEMHAVHEWILGGGVRPGSIAASA